MISKTPIHIPLGVLQKLSSLILSLHCFASLGWSLAYLPAYLLDNSTIILLLMTVKSLKSDTVFQKLYIFLYSYGSPVSVPFFYIRINLLYQYPFLYSYQSLVSVLFSCIEIYDSDIYCDYDSCMLLLDTRLLIVVT